MRDEALTGEPAGQPLSRESFKLVQGADAVSVAEGNTDRRDSASACSALRGLRTWHVGTLFARTAARVQLAELRFATVPGDVGLVDEPGAKRVGWSESSGLYRCGAKQ